METKINRDNMLNHLLEYQLEMAGKTIVDTFHDDYWKFNHTLTRAQHEQFKIYSIKLIKKTFRCNTSKANDTFDWFNKYLGLRIKN